MRNIKALLLFFFLVMLANESAAQKSNIKTKAKSTKIQKSSTSSAGQKIFQTMLPVTAKIMFIDSVVVAKENFLSKIPLNKESGRISYKPSKSESNIWAQYENEQKDRKFYAKGDSAGSAIFTESLLGSGWSNAVQLSEIAEDKYAFQNYPFLCADGVTLFFSAKGPECIGGYDIFMTVYDTDNGSWYQPQNYGLPFNSTANDYLLAIDDLDTLGWLVSDRFQPADSVCIYTFVPTTPRLDFSSENLSPSQLESFAQIKSIDATWKFGNRKDALRRRDAMLNRMKSSDNDRKALFVVNDDRVVANPANFQHEESRQLFRQLEELNNMLTQTNASLDSKREQYRQASESQKQSLSAEILSLEKSYLQQFADIKSLEKRIRNIESNP